MSAGDDRRAGSGRRGHRGSRQRGPAHGDAAHGDATGCPAATTPSTTPAPTPDGAPPTFPSVPAAAADPGRWGRVDDEGTVWLRVEDPDGAATERAVGSWQAGDATEGLAHFALRFDDLRTEADLLVRRLTSGRGEARATLRSATALRERLTDAAVVGDVAGLAARLDAVVAAAEQADEIERVARAGAREDAVARKEALIAEAEALAEETTRWKHAGDRFAAMVDEWKAVTGIDRRTDDALWKRFSRARETFARRRGAHFAELDRARTAAKARKEELVAEAEALTDSDGLGPHRRALQGAHGGVEGRRAHQQGGRRRAVGAVPRRPGHVLRPPVRDVLRPRRRVHRQRDGQGGAPRRGREDRPLRRRRRPRGAARRPGAVGRDRQGAPRAGARVRRRVSRRSRTGCAPRSTAAGRRVDPETEARVAQFRSRVEGYEAQAAKAHAAGDHRRAKEAERQAAQWREWLAAAEQAAAVAGLGYRREKAYPAQRAASTIIASRASQSPAPGPAPAEVFCDQMAHRPVTEVIAHPAAVTNTSGQRAVSSVTAVPTTPNTTASVPKSRGSTVTPGRPSTTSQPEAPSPVQGSTAASSRTSTATAATRAPAPKSTRASRGGGPSVRGGPVWGSVVRGSVTVRPP